MRVDLTLFDEAVPDQSPHLHYDAALAAITAARAATTVILPVPVAVHDGAATIDPTEQSTGYHWVYSVQHESQVYFADLTGRARGNTDAVWEMRVSSNTTEPTLNNFLWYSGTALLTEREGSWRVFDVGNPTGSTPALDIFWSHDAGGTWDVVYKNILVGSPSVNDLIEFEIAGQLRRLTYYDASAESSAIIQWNPTTGSGFILSPQYNNGAQSCWNSELVDSPCGV
jgi:hypothetical protein